VESLFLRIIENLIGRVSGPLKFKLVIQPLTASILEIRSGLKDAKEGRPPYRWALFTAPAQRSAMLREAWKSVSGVFAIAVIMDGTYQYVVLRWFYVGEALFVAPILAIVPYVLIRGAVNRIVRRR
jgi:hypothetical protein